ncbi:MAG: DUF4166 domain-containing protein [Pseudomonadota bacterium]
MMDIESGPVMRRALGDNWYKLHAAVRRHYDLTPGQEHACTLRGTMDEISHAFIAKPLILAGWLFGALVPYRGTNIPVEVRNRTHSARPAMYWHRTFHFPGRTPHVFSSRMEHLAGSEIVEFVRGNLGICMHLSELDGMLCYTSHGYLWRLGPLSLRIPDWLLLGHAEIIERGVDDDTIALEFTVRHPLWGNTFSYSGTFRLTAA